MNLKTIDYKKKKYAPLLARTLKNALIQKLGKEFPRLGGHRILDLCAEMILEVIARHVRSFDTLQHGQILWLAVDTNERLWRYKRMSETNLIPIALNLHDEDDVQAIIARQTREQRLTLKAVRLCNEAHQQGALLGNCDLAALLNVSEGYVAHLLTQYERDKQTVLPRRATLQDVGTGVTHKGIICRKRYLEGKSPHDIARETYHSLQSVDRYLGQFERVRHCRRQQHMNVNEIAFTLNCTVNLVEQYIKLDDEINGKQCLTPDDDSSTMDKRTGG